MGDGTMIAAVLVGVVGIILIFTILKINENLNQMNAKMDRVLKQLEKKKTNSPNAPLRRSTSEGYILLSSA